MVFINKKKRGILHKKKILGFLQVFNEEGPKKAGRFTMILSEKRGILQVSINLTKGRAFYYGFIKELANPSQEKTRFLTFLTFFTFLDILSDVLNEIDKKIDFFSLF